MLVDQVQENVLKEEYSKKAPCECCEWRHSAFIYLVKSGFCTVLSHVCGQCKVDLEADCIREKYEFQFLAK